MKKMRSLAVLALVMVASYFVGCSASDGENIQAPSKPMARYKAQEVVKETLPLIDAFVEAQYNYALGKDSVPQWDQYLVNPDPNLKQRIDRAVYLRKGGPEMLSYSGHFKAVEYSKIFFEKDRWVLDDVVLWSELLQGNPSNPSRSQGGMNYQFSLKKMFKGSGRSLVGEMMLISFLIQDGTIGEQMKMHPKLSEHLRYLREIPLGMVVIRSLRVRFGTGIAND